jgi:hypothetical protein
MYSLKLKYNIIQEVCGGEPEWDTHIHIPHKKNISQLEKLPTKFPCASKCIIAIDSEKYWLIRTD